MAQLIKPDGTLGDIVDVDDAITYCQQNPTWSWQLIYDPINYD